jgi:hypothetical protein
LHNGEALIEIEALSVDGGVVGGALLTVGREGQLAHRSRGGMPSEVKVNVVQALSDDTIFE